MKRNFAPAAAVAVLTLAAATGAQAFQLTSADIKPNSTIARSASKPTCSAAAARTSRRR